MDNRINEIRRKISALRADMTELEGSIRSQIKNDLDCAESAMRLMADAPGTDGFDRRLEGCRRRRPAADDGRGAAQGKSSLA
jgi:hypothetical protein